MEGCVRSRVQAVNVTRFMHRHLCAQAVNITHLHAPVCLCSGRACQAFSCIGVSVRRPRMQAPPGVGLFVGNPE